MRRSYRAKYWDERQYRKTLEKMIFPVLIINTVTMAILLWTIHQIWEMVVICC